jgi:hypothetical protein
MLQRRQDVLDIIERLRPASVRQVFYQAEIAGIVEKTEAGYGRIGDAAVWLREGGYCPFSWIADATRWRRKPDTHTSIEAALQETVENYRRAVWRDQSAYVEVWVEKEALAGTIYPVTAEYDVPLMPARGYSSLSFLYSAAQEIRDHGKPAYVYQLGDWDPSGQDAARHIEAKLRQYAPSVPIHFEKLGVTAQQIGTCRPGRRRNPTAARRHGPVAIASSWTRSIRMSCASWSATRSNSTSRPIGSRSSKQRRRANATGPMRGCRRSNGAMTTGATHDHPPRPTRSPATAPRAGPDGQRQRPRRPDGGP